MNKQTKKILIATGGTGGHVIPAYSLAKFLIKKNISVQILTDQRGLKFLNNRHELNIQIINSSRIYKENFFSLFLSFFKILISFFQSLKILINDRPNIIFGMGGYSSFPVCLASKILRIPFIIYENNLLIGKTNKYLLPLAYKMFTSYSDLEGINKKFKHKIFTMGNIIREEIFNLKKQGNLVQKKNISILVVGGSQAAKSFGEKLPIIFEQCLQNKIELKIYQQCLTDQMQDLNRRYKELNIEYEIFDFNFDLLKYFSKIDMVITRAGASMLGELLNCRIPFLSIPLPNSADNHQFKNAHYFKKKGFAFMIEEHEINSRLFPLIKSIHEDKKLLNQIVSKQNNHSDKKVLENILSQIESLIND